MITLPATGRLPYAPLQLCYHKNTLLTFYTHPVLGGCQNNSTIGTLPDPLSAREGLACESTHQCQWVEGGGGGSSGDPSHWETVTS